MRIERSLTTISWIPSDSLKGMLKVGETLKVAHHDAPPPDTLGDEPQKALDDLRDRDGYRFSNRLSAWVEVEESRITAAGYSGGGRMGSTTLALGIGDVTVAGVALPDLQTDVEQGDGWARFRQTTGGRTGVPIPRAVPHPPFVRYHAPIVWTTLEMTIHADGSHDARLVGASQFPRHWVYDSDGALTAKSGLTDLKTWLREAAGDRTPWGDSDSEALVTAVETALERELSATIMRGGEKPDVRRVKAGKVLTEQGRPGAELLLLLDGVVSVEVDGTPLVELGPGAVLGERAVLEGGVRTSTVRCVTPCRVAVAPADAIDRERLEALAAGHHREDAPA
jgi:hypothetical protein